ncbi:MAG: DUF3868 domain-containing protein [Odoribacteraceae bacterium]|jgi:outer membrane protein OmpA-like peptidoglycan-associated protein|nr:DUF3868 domain-containing protein [Odoribacteraceae bacterium]
MKYYILFFIALALPFASQAQSPYKGEFVFKHVHSKKIKDKVTLDFTIDLKKVKMDPQMMLTLTPVIRSYDNTNTHVFDPIIISGGKRDKALSRALAFGAIHFDIEPQARIRHRNGHPGEVVVQLELPYSSWLRRSKLIINEVSTGCRACEIGQRELEVAAQTLSSVYTPSYQVSFIYPPVESPKKRSDIHVARLDFAAGKSDVSVNFNNNAAMLEKVDNFFAEIFSDPNLSISTCNVVGYASPDGDYDSNMLLSEARVDSFVNYLKNQYKIPAKKIQVRWHGEDWEGVLKLIEPLSFQDKSEVEKIIRTETNITRRKARLKALSGGTTYRFLLDEVFPALRRSEYTINYIVRPFDVAKAKSVIYQKPCHLNLNEFYLVAHTYEKGSPEFNETFQIAVESFPEDPIARINASAASILDEQYDVAITRLLSINQGEAWNNLGIAYSNVKNYDEALYYFERAVKAGNKEAVDNLKELQMLLEDYLY